MATIKAIVEKSALAGPRSIKISDEATFSLPVGDVFLPAEAAARVMQAYGQAVNEKVLVGMVFPARDEGGWGAVLSFAKEGYVRDDDAQNWKADDLLHRMRVLQAQSNPVRKSHGVPELDVEGWAQPPTYDTTMHRVMWATISHKQGEPDDDAHRYVNYETVALGRDGHLLLGVASHLAAFNQSKIIADGLLADIDFDNGKHYADFDKTTDHVAEYGLAALVVGVAAKKLGLLAVFLAFVAKFAKIGVALPFAAAAIRRRFKKRVPARPVAAVTTDRQEPR